MRQQVLEAGRAFAFRERAPQNRDFFSRRGFGQRIGFGRRPALVVIDTLNALTDPAQTPGADRDAQIEAITPLIAAARIDNAPIVSSTVIDEDARFHDTGDVVSLEETRASLQTIGANPHADRGTPARA